MTPLDDLIADLGCASPVYVPARRYPPALVREAIASGLAVEWPDSPAGRAILLSSLACERWGLELADVELERSRWIPIGSGRPMCGSGQVGGVPDGPSDAPSPLDLLIAREQALEALSRPAEAKKPGGAAAALAAGLGPGRALPNLGRLILLGSTDTNWSPGLEQPGQKPCPRCGGRPLELLECCLPCLRSGLDAQLPPVEAHMKPRSGAARLAASAGGLAGGSGKPKAPGRPRRRTT